jgi:hypothetical protein
MTTPGGLSLIIHFLVVLIHKAYIFMRKCFRKIVVGKEAI